MDLCAHILSLDILSSWGLEEKRKQKMTRNLIKELNGNITMLQNLNEARFRAAFVTRAAIAQNSRLFEFILTLHEDTTLGRKQSHGAHSCHRQKLVQRVWPDAIRLAAEDEVCIGLK